MTYPISAHVCFLKGVWGPATLLDFLQNVDCGFVPQFVRAPSLSPGSLEGTRIDASVVARLRKRHSGPITLSDGLSSLGLSGLGGGVGEQLILKTHSPETQIAFVEAALPVDGATSAFFGDSEDAFWQSADLVNTYQVHGRSWEHLPVIEVPGPLSDRIDVSGNAGRREIAWATWLWPAERMWFKQPVFELLDRDKLLGLPVGDVTVQDDLVTVQLFGRGDERQEIRRAQQAFRDWMGLDGLTDRIVELNRRSADPELEIETGDFEGGAVRRVVEWLDGDGIATQRSQARSRRVSLRAANGSILTTWAEPAA